MSVTLVRRGEIMFSFDAMEQKYRTQRDES